MSYIGNSPISVAFLTDTFSGTGAQVAFTMTVAPANTSSIIVAVTGVVQDPSTYSVSGTTLTFSAAPPNGTSNISVRYLGIPASGVTTTAYRTVTNTTATASQTSFTIPSYTVGYVDVYRNGVYLPTTDYTATTGTTVVLNTGATSGDTVTTISFFVSSVLNAIPATAGAISSSYLASSLTLTTPIVSTTIGVGGATASASGSGITFPATASTSSNVNTLDDYEEGTWTPSVGGNATYTGRWGTYTKVGNLVTVMFNIGVNVLGTGSTTLISDLPFAINNPTYANDQSGCLSFFSNIATSVYCLNLRGSVGGTTLFFSGTTAATTSINNSVTVFGNSTSIQAAITYQTTA